jgi:hypothetical protein
MDFAKGMQEVGDMHILLRSLVALSFMHTGVAVAEDTYHIRLRVVPEAGKSIDVKTESYQELNSRTTDHKGKEVSKFQYKVGARLEFTETLVKAESGKPVKFHRVYRKAQASVGKKNDKLPFEGKQVQFEKKGKAWHVRYQNGKELPDGFGDGLSQEIEKSHLAAWFLPLLPTMPVKVGATWPLDHKAVKAMLLPPEHPPTVTIDPKRSKGKLVKVYRKGKQLFGVLEITAEATSMVAEDETKTKGILKLTLKAIADTLIDGSDTQGSYKSDITWKGEGVGEVDGKKITAQSMTQQRFQMTISPQK